MPKQIGIKSFFSNPIKCDVSSGMIKTENSEIENEHEQSESYQPRNKKLRLEEPLFDSILGEKYHPPSNFKFPSKKQISGKGEF